MIYAVVVRVPAKVDVLADALGKYQTHAQPRKVYVVGMSEEDALAAALSDQLVMEIEGPDSTMLLRFKFTETIGTEYLPGDHYEELLALARNRVAQLQRKHPSPMARMVA